MVNLCHWDFIYFECRGPHNESVLFLLKCSRTRRHEEYAGREGGRGSGSHSLSIIGIWYDGCRPRMAAVTEASTTQSGTSLKLVFSPTKRQFKWNGDLTSLKDFWITNLEGGNINSLLNVSSNGSTEVLKFESVTINFYVSTKTLQARRIERPLRQKP